MNCLANICYVCLEKKDSSLININSSVSVNADIVHILGYLPCNLAWLKTKRTILICEQCCLRLRETYEFLAMCLKNSALLQGYTDILNTASVSSADNEAELRVDLNNKIKCEIKVEDEETYTVRPILEAAEEVFVNVDESLVKEEDSWRREVADAKEEELYLVNRRAHITSTVSDRSGVTSTPAHTRNKKKRIRTANKTHKCSTCSKSFSRNSMLQIHTRVHTGEKPYTCALCAKCFTQQSGLSYHKRTHTGEKPYQCSVCKKCFGQSTYLVCHMRIHTGEKPYKCARCDKRFRHRYSQMRHIHRCPLCSEDFCLKFQLRSHMRVHADKYNALK